MRRKYIIISDEIKTVEMTYVNAMNSNLRTKFKSFRQICHINKKNSLNTSVRFF